MLGLLALKSLKVAIHPNLNYFTMGDDIVQIVKYSEIVSHVESLV
jgi:hypothetical protein